MAKPRLSNADAHAIADAVLYAMRCGCFFPHRSPRGRRCTVPALIKWGAMGHLHNVVATACREREDTP